MKSGDNDIEFLRGEKLGKYLGNYAAAFESPFLRSPRLIPVLTKLSGYFALFLENLIGEKLFIKKTISPIERIPPRFHILIKRLIEAGILKNCLFPESMPYWPRLFAVNLKSNNGITSSGYALDYDAASTKAFAEFLEWHSFSACDDKKFIFGSWGDLKQKNAIDPGKFSGFSEKQLGKPEYAQYRISETSKFNWVECFSLISQKKCLAPAQLVYLGYGRRPDEPQIRQTTSNGGAAGSSREMALEHALSEAIERDALMIYWLNRIAPPKIDIKALKKMGSEKINLLLEEYEKYKIDMALFDITTDIGAPVVLTAIRNSTPGRPSLFLSPKCDLDVESAIFASLLDGLRAGFGPDVSEEDIIRINKKASLFTNIEERRAYWCDKRHLEEARFFFDGPMKIMEKNEYCGADSKTKLKKLEEIFAANNLDAYVADATSPIAEEFGLTVVMALVSGLYPLYLDEKFKYLGLRRLYEAPVKMGILKNPKKEYEINLLPHPFL